MDRKDLIWAAAYAAGLLRSRERYEAVKHADGQCMYDTESPGFRRLLHCDAKEFADYAVRGWTEANDGE